MKAHKSAALAAAVTAAGLTLAACGSSSSSSNSASGSTAPAASKGSMTVGYIETGPVEYYIRGVDGAQMAAKSLGVNLKVYNSNNSSATELSNVEDAISQGVKGLVIYSVGKSSLDADLAAANSAHIPAVVLYGYDPSIASKAVGFVQAQPPVTGKEAGAWTASHVSSGDVAIIEGLLGRGDAEGYTAGYKAGIAANPKLKVVSTIAADWDRSKAQSAMADILTAHPDLKAVFVQNDDMSIGAIDAIKAAGKEGQVTVVSQNGSSDGLNALANGTMSADVAWSPAQEAQMALVRLVDYLKKGTKPESKLCVTPSIMVTKANMSAAPPWIPTAASTAKALTAACAS